MVDERELNDTLKKITKEYRFRKYEGTAVELSLIHI